METEQAFVGRYGNTLRVRCSNNYLCLEAAVLGLVESLTVTFTRQTAHHVEIAQIRDMLNDWLGVEPIAPEPKKGWVQKVTERERVIIESPYGGNVERNERYARACVADSLSRGEAPFASHLLYTQPGVLDDSVPEERAQGIQAGFAWRAGARTVVYTDLGVSTGMVEGIHHAQSIGSDIEYRTLGGEWAK